MRKNKNKNIGRSSIPVFSAKGARTRGLSTIGEIAQEYEILPSTINFYTREGLIPEDARSIGGYRLYDRKKALAILQRIEDLQVNKRLSIAEIKKVI